MQSVDYIVVHCSATPSSLDIGFKEIDSWHKKRGWAGCGYHYIVRRDGAIEVGRPETQAGAHVKNFNHCSIGICMVGGLDNKRIAKPEYTNEQWATLGVLVDELHLKYPNAEILGHRDFPDVNKACPCFDVKEWWATVHE